MDTNKIEELRHILSYDLNIGVPGSADLGDKMGLIMMICYLTDVLKKKKPNLTHLDVLKLCMKDDFPREDELQTIALVCEWFAWGCLKFPDLGLKAKEMPSKIKSGILELCPF